MHFDLWRQNFGSITIEFGLVVTVHPACTFNAKEKKEEELIIVLQIALSTGLIKVWDRNLTQSRHH